MEANPYKSPESVGDEHRSKGRSRRHIGVFVAPICSLVGAGIILLASACDGYLTLDQLRALGIIGIMLFLVGAVGIGLSMISELVGWIGRK